MTNQLHEILSCIPVNIDTSRARVLLKRLIKEQEKPQTEAIPYPRLVE